MNVENIANCAKGKRNFRLSKSPEQMLWIFHDRDQVKLRSSVLKDSRLIEYQYMTQFGHIVINCITVIMTFKVNLSLKIHNGHWIHLQFTKLYYGLKFGPES